MTSLWMCPWWMSTSGCIRSFAISCSRVRPTCNTICYVKGTGRPHEDVKEIYDVINKINILLKKILKKHLVVLLKMMSSLKILLQILKKKMMMKNLLMLPLEIKIHLKIKYMKRTLMTKAFKHPSVLCHMKARV
jgi:hypothetical protein